MDKKKSVAELKTLEEQMQEHSKMTKKIEQQTKDLIVNPEWKIIEREGEYYAIDFWYQHHLINVDLREKFPNSYFHSPECDSSIIGYDAFNGSIIYDLWSVAEAQAEISIESTPRLDDKVYDLGRFLRWMEESDFDGKIPSRHIFLPYFFNILNNYPETFDLYFRINGLLAELNTSETELLRSHEKSKTLEEQMLEYSKRIDRIEQLAKDLVNYDRSIDDDFYDSYVVSDYDYDRQINMELRERLPNSYFHSPECDDSIIGYDAFSGAIIYDLWKSGRRVSMCRCDTYDGFDYTAGGIGELLRMQKESDLDGKVPPVNIFTKDFTICHFPLQESINASRFDFSLFNFNGAKEHYQNWLESRIADCKRSLKGLKEKVWQEVESRRQYYLNCMQECKNRGEESKYYGTQYYEKLLENLNETKEYEYSRQLILSKMESFVKTYEALG